MCVLGLEGKRCLVLSISSLLEGRVKACLAILNRSELYLDQLLCAANN